MDGFDSFQKLKEELESVMLLEALGEFKAVLQVKLLRQFHGDIEYSSLLDLLNCEWAGASALQLFHSAFCGSCNDLSFTVLDSTEDIIVLNGLKKMGLKSEHPLSLRIILHKEFHSNLFISSSLSLEVGGEPYHALCTFT